MYLMMEKRVDLFIGRRALMMIPVIITLVLGLILITLFSFFVYQEVYNEDGSSYDVCKASVVKRYLAIEKLEGSEKDLARKIGAEAGEKITPFSSKCKTNLVTVDYRDYSRALEEIGYEIVACHNLYGKGEHPLYSMDLFSGETACFICSRIRFEDDVVDFYSDKLLNVGEFLLAKEGFFDGERKTYYNYLYENQEDLSKLSGEELEKLILEASRFNASEGDIYVIYRFEEVAIKDFRDWYAVVEFGQLDREDNQREEDTILERCQIIETIP